MYAAIDSGNISGAVYGIGETEEAAREDATRRGEDRDTFDIVPCSDEAAGYVREHGGAPSPWLRVSSTGVSARVHVSYSDGSTDYADTYAEAVEGVRSRYGAQCYAEQSPDRGLVWPTEAASVDDSGARAVASIRTALAE